MINYQEVIADLEARRLAIDNAIDVLRSLMGNGLSTFNVSQPVSRETLSAVSDIIGQPSQPTIDKSDVIEREDIVKCVKAIGRDPGTDADLIPKIGNEYRVIEIIKKKGQVIMYEVLDDISNNRIRMPMFPSEIELLRKHIPPPPRVMGFSVTKKCVCGEVNALNLQPEGDRYFGHCINCGLALEEKRLVAAQKE